MVKLPRAGQAKTRLARDVGTSAALNFYRNTSSAVIERLFRSPRWQTMLSVAPDIARSDACWPMCIPRIAQGTGDLGQRMQRAIAAMPPGPVVLIGSDIPAIRPSHIAAAFRALGDHDAVFGPASDGGYWLTGMARRKPFAGCFDNVRWSSPHALADTIGNLGDHRIALIDQLSDVDDATDLAIATPWFARRILPFRV